MTAMSKSHARNLFEVASRIQQHEGVRLEVSAVRQERPWPVREQAEEPFEGHRKGKQVGYGGIDKYF